MSTGFAYDLTWEKIELGEVTVEVSRLRDLDSTIDALFQDYHRTGKTEWFEDHCPYFGVPWPAGVVLARFAVAQARRWRDLSVLEIGCGLALPSLALAKLGVGDVTASDLHPDVPDFLHRSLERNGLRVRFLPLDTRKDFTDADVLLASDVLYDRTQPAALLKFLKGSARWREAVFTDPGRGYWEEFQDLGRAAGFEVTEWVDQGVFFARWVRV